MEIEFERCRRNAGMGVSAYADRKIKNAADSIAAR
jgi:hypothetical protein